MNRPSSILSDLPLSIKDDMKMGVKNVVDSVSLIDNQVRYCLYFRRNHIIVYEFDKHREISHFSLSFEDLGKLPDFFAQNPNAPIFIMLSEWALDMKTANLSKVPIWDMPSALKTFARGEFSPSDYVISAKNQDGFSQSLFSFLAVKSDAALSHFFEILQQIQNPIAAITVEELWSFESTLEKAKHTIFPKTLNDWTISLSLEDNHWKLFVGFQKNLMLARWGYISDTQKMGAYLSREILDTVHYMDRFGYKSSQKIHLICPNNAPLLDVKDLNIDLCSVFMKNNLVSRFVFHNSHDHILKNIFKIMKPLTLQSFQVPGLSWQNLAFHLPRYFINIFIPAIILTFISATVYFAKWKYYESAAKANQLVLKDYKSKHKAAPQENKNAKIFEYFKSTLQNNPKAMFDHVAKALTPYATATSIQWSSKNDRFNAQIQLKLKTVKNFQKTIKVLKEKSAQKIHKKFPTLSLQWRHIKNQTLILTLVGPSKTASKKPPQQPKNSKDLGKKVKK